MPKRTSFPDVSDKEWRKRFCPERVYVTVDRLSEQEILKMTSPASIKLKTNATSTSSVKVQHKSSTSHNPLSPVNGLHIVHRNELTTDDNVNLSPETDIGHCRSLSETSFFAHVHSNYLKISSDITFESVDYEWNEPIPFSRYHVSKKKTSADKVEQAETTDNLSVKNSTLKIKTVEKAPPLITIDDDSPPLDISNIDDLFNFIDPTVEVVPLEEQPSSSTTSINHQIQVVSLADQLSSNTSVICQPTVKEKVIGESKVIKQTAEAGKKTSIGAQQGSSAPKRKYSFSKPVEKLDQKISTLKNNTSVGKPGAVVKQQSLCNDKPKKNTISSSGFVIPKLHPVPPVPPPVPRSASELDFVVQKVKVKEKQNEKKQAKFVPFESALQAGGGMKKKRLSLTNEEQEKRAKAAHTLSSIIKPKKPELPPKPVQTFKKKVQQPVAIQKENKCTTNNALLLLSSVETKLIKLPPKSILRSSTNQKSHNKRVTFNEDKNVTKLLHCEESKNSPVKTVSVVNVDDKLDRQEVPKLPVSEQIMFYVTQWNAAWLQEYAGDSVNSLPPIIDKQPFKKTAVPHFFIGINRYVEVLRPLYLCEIFEQAYRNYKFVLNQEITEGVVCPAKDIKTNSVFQDFTVRAVVLKTCEDFQFQSLVEFSLNEVDKKFLGIMVQFSSHPVIRINDVITELRKYVASENVTDYKVISFLLRTKAKYSVLPRTYQGPISFKCVLKMAPIFRQTDMIEVLQGIGQPRTNMIYDPPCQNLFSFAINDHTICSENLKEHFATCAQSVFVNESKLYAFSYDKLENRDASVFNLIECIQTEKVKDESRQKTAILILGSNDISLESIARRIMDKNDKSKNSRRFANFVRVGDKEDVAEDVWRYSLETLVDINLKQQALIAVTREDETSGQNNKSPNDLLNEIGYTKGRLACLDANDVPANEERMMLENNLRELERQLKMSTTDEKRISKSMKYRQGCTVIIHADIIALTFQNLFSQPLCNILYDDRRPLKIACAVVVDADNVPELETIIPLRFGIDKLILFGSEDKKPLSFVKSEVAKTLHFGSFYDRLRRKKYSERI